MSAHRRDLPRSSTFARAPPPAAGSIDTAQPRSITAPNPRGNTPDPFLMTVVVMVDEATEPGITDADAARHRAALTDVVLERGSTLPTPLNPTTGGQAVAFALRKRLKSDDEHAVLNTLTLLDELMRTVPYFYRYIANDKFFRRLWRFVIPDYKNGVMSMIPIFGKPKIHSGMRGAQSVVSERVRILIRAWAEELSVMLSGRFDPNAGFLIERYNNKRTRITFPEVPRTPTPWVCPVTHHDRPRRPSSSASPNSAAKRSPAKRSNTLTLAEVENTVNLFSNIVHNATHLSDLNDELCTELAARCKAIEQDLTRMSMNMSKEQELMRAISVSETLQKSLNTYRSSLKTGRIVQQVPVIDSISLHSDDEGYDQNRPHVSTGSLDRHRDAPSRSLYEDSSDYSSEGREQWRANGRASNSVTAKQSELERANRERELERANRERERDREQLPKERTKQRESRRGRDPGSSSENVPSRSTRNASRREAAVETSPPKTTTTEKRSRKPPSRAPPSRRGNSDSDLPTLSERSKSSKKESLIAVPAQETSSSEEDTAPNGDSFAMLAERYSSQKPSRKSKSKPPSKDKSVKQQPSKSALVPTSQEPTTQATSHSNSLPVGMPGGVMNPNPATMYASMSGMGYPPMMMPNMYSMYGSVHPMQMHDPMAMMGAYQTVNPAMYYQSMNPSMYSSMGAPPMGAMQGYGAVPGVQGNSGSVATHTQPNTASSENAPQDTNQTQTTSQTQPSSERSPPEPSTASPNPQQLLSSQPSTSFYGSLPSMPAAMPMGMPPAMPQGMSQGMSQGMPQAMPQAMSQGMSQGMPQGMPQGMQQGMPPGMPPGMPQGVPGAMGMPSASGGLGPPGMSGSMGAGMSQNSPGGSQDMGNQAAAYQSAMQQAALAFNAAASMYRSVQGQPVIPQVAGQPQGAPVTQPASITPAEEEGQN